MILVTGGTGLLGTHLLYDLISKGYQVRALKREGSVLENTLRIFWWKNPSGEALYDRIEWVDGDLLDIDTLTDAMQGISHVFHCAALITLQSGRRNKLHKVNAEGTANMVNAALKSGIEWFCHVSSIAALGSTEGNELIDESTPWKTDVRHSDYSMTKYAGEREVWRGIEEGLNAVIINPSVILGPGPRGKASCRLFRSISKGLRFYPPGSNGFVDVRDVVEVMLKLMDKQKTGQRYIVSGGNYSYQEVFNTMAQLLEKPVPSYRIPGSCFKYLWVLDFIRSAITLQPQDLTRSTAQSAIEQVRYSSEKIQSEMGIVYRSLEESLSYLKEYCFDQHTRGCP